jgi:hypothetical protein
VRGAQGQQSSTPISPDLAVALLVEKARTRRSASQGNPRYQRGELGTESVGGSGLPMPVSDSDISRVSPCCCSLADEAAVAIHAPFDQVRSLDQISPRCHKTGMHPPPAAHTCTSLPYGPRDGSPRIHIHTALFRVTAITWFYCVYVHVRMCTCVQLHT